MRGVDWRRAKPATLTPTLSRLWRERGGFQTPPAHAEGTRRLSITDALKLAQERNPTFSKASLTYESSRLTYLKTLHGLGWVESFTASSDYKRDESFSYSKYFNTTGERVSATRSRTLSNTTSWNLKRTFGSGMATDFYSKLTTSDGSSRYNAFKGALADDASSRYKYITQKFNPEVGVNLTLPIIGKDKNSTDYSRKQADASWAQAEIDFEEAKKSLVLSVRQGYFDLLKYRRMAALRKEVLAEAEERLEVTKKRLSVGMTTEMDVSQAELTVLRNRADLADAVFSEQQAQSRFNSLIGLPLDDYYDLTDGFPPEPVREVTMKMVQSRVISASGDLRRMNKDIEVSTISVEQAKSKMRPAFAFKSNLALEGERRDLPRVLRNPEEKYSFTLTYDFPFGEKVTQKADLELAEAGLSTKVLERDELNQSLILDATETYQELLKVQRRLAIARQSREVSERSLRIAQAKFDEGRGEITDVISAKTSLVNAQVEELNNLYSLAVATAELEMLTGESI
ncbi:MAG: hypothetical protein A3G34_15715 [Candidatus Lindowbacteria bacterium RIFCSPLOWO2_12_FULL_62_27]|nr:MAG: hypothetical protein A3G34_15715 [Candidatus Lindowbacteria bacterium RIFCSPLOWO2_12_FULL_62_27]